MRAEIDAARKALGDPGRIVFPPAAEKALVGAGLPLAELLRLQFTGNAHILTMLMDVSGHHYKDWSSMAAAVDYDCDATAMLEGHFLWHQKEWPADIDRYDLFVEWCDRGGRRFPLVDPTDRQGLLDGLERYNPAAEDILEDAYGIARAVRTRYQAMMAMLRSGELEASGHLKDGAPAQISLAVWSSETTRISFVNNALLKRVAVDITDFSWGRVRAERTEPVWSDVVVRRPPQPQTEVQKVVLPARNRGGNPGHIPWDTAIDRMLVGLLRPADYPENASDMARIIAKHFEDMDYDSPDIKDIKKRIKSRFPDFYERCTRGGE